MEERRRSRRHTVDYGEFAGVPFSLTVQIMDISVVYPVFVAAAFIIVTIAAILIFGVKVGVRGALRLTIGGQSLTTDVAVTRVSPHAIGTDERYRIGAMFVGISPEHRQMIERFIN